MSLYDLVAWAYYRFHGRTPPDPVRYLRAPPGWIPPGTRVLDYGGGEGRWATRLAETAALVVVADIDERALRRVPASRSIGAVLVDGATLPFASEAFGLVFLHHVVHHVERLPTLVPELRRVLEKHGRVVIVEFEPTAPVTRVYRLLARFREHPCNFYPPASLVRVLGEYGLAAEARRLDAFQYAVVGWRSEVRGGEPPPSR